MCGWAWTRFSHHIEEKIPQKCNICKAQWKSDWHRNQAICARLRAILRNMPGIKARPARLMRMNKVDCHDPCTRERQKRCQRTFCRMHCPGWLAMFCSISLGFGPTMRRSCIYTKRNVRDTLDKKGVAHSDLRRITILRLRAGMLQS